ncbi:MAG: Aminopeptidase [Deltaproteobacteria bacterium]|nr:Aminopeptidase [Deltaproteobacteria bacterium]
MAELRREPVTRMWVVVTNDHPKGPSDYLSFKPPYGRLEAEGPCPFCPGNEGMTPQETFSLSQEKLFIPRNIQSAYEKGTRSPDGKPGSEYWQNSADYKIDVEVFLSTYQIIGKERITYYNNSPDSLKRIVLRLYPNIFKKGSTRDYSITTVLIPLLISLGMIFSFSSRPRPGPSGG